MRKKPYLISHPVPKSNEEQREDYRYCLLLLFTPFRNEVEELLEPGTGSCIPVFERELLVNEKLAAYHDKMQMFQKIEEENTDAIEKEQNKSQPSQAEPLPQKDDCVDLLGEPLEAAAAMQELRAAMQLTAEESLEQNLDKMNVDQYRIFERLANHLSASNTQLLMFISGAGGTGKSFLINTLKIWAKQYFSGLGTTIAVAAYTGLAAYNVNGVTLHRLLQLPFSAST
jgi:hypothetical protein